MDLNSKLHAVFHVATRGLLLAIVQDRDMVFHSQGLCYIPPAVNHTGTLSGSNHCFYTQYVAKFTFCRTNWRDKAALAKWHANRQERARYSGLTIWAIMPGKIDPKRMKPDIRQY
jgi:hypothetical protein